MENTKGICRNCKHYIYVGQRYKQQEDSMCHTSKTECEWSIRLGLPREEFGPVLLRNAGLLEEQKLV